MKTIIVTGAAGFIGSNFVEIALEKGYRVVGYDALTYAGHLENVEQFQANPNFKFIHANILDGAVFEKALHENSVTMVAHFAAESHVDKSISGPGAFIETNVNGTFALLTAARAYYESLTGEAKKDFRFLHVSTDEVFGTLGETGKFSETTPYAPNSPYSASKAASDLLVRAWFHTYHLPTIITNCSNNYGAKQFPEKLIPHMILSALQGKPLPVYGKGENVRDWLWVEDHAKAIVAIFHKGRIGESYNVGGLNEWTNIELVRFLCRLMDRKLGRSTGESEKLITYVTDRKGHDLRYAIDATKLENELGWTPSITFEEGLEKTVDWYLANTEWVEKVTSGTYQTYYSNMYENR
jgi:dTDP-glucose 4,6-dehydratase